MSTRWDNRTKIGGAALCSFAVLLLLALGASAADSCRDEAKQFDSRKFPDGSRQVLSVDIDRRVIWDEFKANGDLEFSQVLGTVTVLPPEFPIGMAIPGNEVAIQQLRYTCNSAGWELWFVVSIGFRPDEGEVNDSPRPFQIFRVFKVSKAGKQLLLTRKYLGVADLFVDRVNSSSEVQAVLQFIDGHATLVDMWSITAADNLDEISLDNLQEGGLEESNRTVVNVSPTINNKDQLWIDESANGPPEVHLYRYCQWDQATRKYRLVDESKTVTKSVPAHRVKGKPRR
jgi:hypothetical protein